MTDYANHTEAVVTLLARTKMMKARAGILPLPKITGIAFGDGGTDSDSQVLTPDGSQTELNHELLRKPIDRYTVLSDTKCRYECTLEKGELTGAYISEAALYDEEGDLVAIKNFLPNGKDSDLEMTIQMDDEF